MAANFNPISFRKSVHEARMLVRDDAGDYAEYAAPIEFRTDPLIGRTIRIERYNLDRIIRPDLDALEKQSRELFCPFCPGNLEKVTGRFTPEIVPEGNIRIGEAYAFPNISPYDVYGLVVVLSPERHFIRPDGFTVDLIADALLASQQYLQRVAQADPAAKYPFIAWNYLPPSGGSLVHPHIQANTGYYPTVTCRENVEASASYREEKGTNYWSDLIEQEKRLGERYLGRVGGTEWLTAFAPMGRLSDVMAIFPGKASVLNLTEGDIRDLAAGLLKVFPYLDERNLPSFNLSTYSGFDADSYWTHVRLIPRSSLLYSPLDTSDYSYYQALQHENICIISPEDTCAMLKPHFTD